MCQRRMLVLQPHNRRCETGEMGADFGATEGEPEVSDLWEAPVAWGPFIITALKVRLGFANLLTSLALVALEVRTCCDDSSAAS